MSGSSGGETGGNYSTKKNGFKVAMFGGGLIKPFLAWTYDKGEGLEIACPFGKN